MSPRQQMFCLLTLTLAAAPAACEKRPATPDPAASGSAPPLAPSASAAARKAQAPQAAPALAMLRAARAKDAAAFRACYSQRIRETREQSDWEKNVADANASVARLFGDAPIDDFTFTFAGDDASGKVTMAVPAHAPIPLAVVREGTEWKLDER